MVCHMRNKCFWFALFILFLFAGCKNSRVPAYPRIANMSVCEKEELSRKVCNSDLIFIGHLESIDTGWSTTSGVAIVARQMNFRMTKTLAGNPAKEAITISYVFVNAEQGLLQDDDKHLYRLDDSFYRSGRDFIIGCSTHLSRDWKLEPPSYPILMFCLDYSANKDTFDTFLKKALEKDKGESSPPS